MRKSYAKVLCACLSTALMLISLLSAGMADTTTADMPTVVTTIFPPYDFVRQIAGENAALKMLLPPGSESHSFEPTPRDILAIQNCDLFVYTGGEADAWVDRILASMDTSGMTILKMVDMVDAVEEEHVEGMQEDEDHSHEGAFDDADVKDRPTLSDWAGDWQSGLPYVTDGTLDEVFAHKAEAGEKTAEAFRQYYLTGYQTDYDRLAFDGNKITFYAGDTAAQAEYAYQGYQILTYESRSKGVRYLFEAKDAIDAPKYIQFSDHCIEPTEGLTHFHIYYGNESQEALLAEMENWPTYFLSSMSGQDIVDDFLGHDHGHEEVLDEHVWTAPRNAIRIVNALTEALCAKAPANASVYRQNAEAYSTKLSALDDAFREAVVGAARKTIVFGDRFPFRDLADAYGLTYYAAFPGCANETEASAATIKFLIDKVREEKIPVVFHIELSNEKIADIVCEDTGAKKLSMHSAHNVTKKDFDAGIGYLEIMQNNLEALKEALR